MSKRIHDLDYCLEFVDNQREISLSEGVLPHSSIFSKKYYTISYAYHLGDLTNRVISDLNSIDKGAFE